MSEKSEPDGNMMKIKITELDSRW